FEGVLKPGDRLPSEAELAKQFNVGRHSVREALRILELSGFIVVQKGYGGGPIVKDTVLHQISTLFMDAFRMEKITIDHWTTARIVIEKAILGHVIDNADESDIRKLQENINRAREKIEKKEMATDENFEFHRILTRTSKNPVFEIVVESTIAVLRDLHTRIPPKIQLSANTITYHEEILKAIVEKNHGKAMDLLEEHFLDVKNRLLSLKKREKN
ncbi:MAG: FadR family transcriptional regulator, partial [Deltaproteobacteria bacterium]|nr:FadR family transcriptional regulator [Deltaproteobacteria bacterium]